MRDKQGRFIPGTSGNPGGRPKKADQLRELLSKDARAIAKQVIELAKGGDMKAARLVLDRCIPLERAVMPATPFSLNPDEPLTEQGKSVLAAISRGEIPPDTGRALIDAITALARVTELDEIQRRLDVIEAQQEGRQ